MQFDDATEVVDRLLNQLTQERKELREIAPALETSITDLAEKKTEILTQAEFVTTETTAFETRQTKDSTAL